MNKKDSVCSADSASIVKTTKILELSNDSSSGLHFITLATFELTWSKVSEILLQKIEIHYLEVAAVWMSLFLHHKCWNSKLNFLLHIFHTIRP
jgi:hypothetical protein